MVANPVWKDKSGLGNDLQMKNFLWKLGSGCGSYKEDYTNWVLSLARVEATKTYKSFNVTAVKKETNISLYYQSTSGESARTIQGATIKVTGLADGQELRYISNQIRVYNITSDGVYKLPSIEFEGGGKYYGFTFSKLQESCNITIEQIPDYSGAIVFDGVDDYGICETFPILTKEKGYTVMALRKWIARDNKYEGLVSNIKNWNTDGAFLLEYKNNIDYAVNFGDLTSITISDYPIVYQTSQYYNDQEILQEDDRLGSNVLLVGKLAKNGFEYFSNFALYSLVIIDHDTTEEERQLVIDYWKKEFPWLFFDQAWTVTGKTNEDSDRATIANLTDNGNDLVLSNFLFAGNSGYGLYYQYFGKNFVLQNDAAFPSWAFNSNYSISQYYRVSLNSPFKCYWTSSALQESVKIRFKLTGMMEGDVLAFGSTTNYPNTWNKDGIYIIDLPASSSSLGFSLQTTITEVENRPNTPVTIKLLPFDYEGYLVTDGVDDKVDSKLLLI
ncbi:hypothetical protein [Parabacteroides chongii]|uniref:hypothetical protein n=1 Tax=Parabacteroides chongii TaxID=2685834 RepID=UPI00240D018D|nr:hypothetical protein [Parabacteroides chongii]WFE85062.1 hypothetical protein P3L47_00170 [Parabacteroides chongii]